MLAQILFIFHVLISVTLIGLILLQQGKGAEAGASFGSGASQTVFGSQGSGSFLFKLTAFFALIFFVTSLTLGYLAGHRDRQPDPIQKLDGLTQPAVMQKTSEVPHRAVQKESNPTLDSSTVNKKPATKS